MQLVAHPCFPPMRSLASFVIFRWGNAFEQKLEVGPELRSPASYYTLTTDDVTHKTESMHKCIATPSEEGQATATGNMHRNVVKFGSAVFELRERTDRHTNSTMLRNCILGPSN